MKPKWIFAISTLVLFVCSMPSRAQWSTDPTVNNAICTAANNQAVLTSVSDGAGGAIITWTDFRSGYTDVYAQRIDASGVVRWTVDGVGISTATLDQGFSTIVSDGAGGAIIAWSDYRSFGNDIYAQRINASGVVQWAANGIAICTATSDQRDVAIASDGAGGAIIAWRDFRRPGNYSAYADIYAQRINASGVVQWAVDGVAICTATDYQGTHAIISDGTGGAMITWYDYRGTGYSNVYAQRINASGAVQWAVNGVAICTAIYSQNYPTIVNDGAGGAIITWQDARSGSSFDVYAQRIDPSGVAQWTANGVVISTATSHQQYPTLVSDGAGGAIITWTDYRNSGYGYSDIYAQRINASGLVQWTADGVAISTATTDQYLPTIVGDGAGGAIITWWDFRNGGYGYIDIYAQRINTSGVAKWTADGVPICTATNDQYRPTIAGDDAGGAIIAWEDHRNGNSDVYAQRVRSDGTLGGNSAPLADAGSDQTAIVNETVQLEGSGSSDPDGDPLTYTWEITSKPAGSNATLSNLSIVNPTFVADVAGEFRVSLVVNDGTVNSTLDEVLITVITAQDATQSLIEQVQALNEPQGNGLIGKLQVVIARLDDNNFDKAIEMLQQFIDQVEVFIGNGTLTEEEGLPLINAANVIIAALNTTGTAAQLNSDPSNFMSKTEGALPTDYRLEQNSPNPFNPSTTISFALPEAGEVSLAIYGMSGRLVRTLVESAMNAGRHSVVWNARDEHGRHVASGVYVYVIKAGNFIAQKKLLLMK